MEGGHSPTQSRVAKIYMYNLGLRHRLRDVKGGAKSNTKQGCQNINITLALDIGSEMWRAELSPTQSRVAKTDLIFPNII